MYMPKFMRQKVTVMEDKIRVILCKYGIVEKEKQDEFMDELFRTLGVIK